MDFINCVKSFKYENCNLQFSYYADGLQEPDLTIQPLDNKSELYLSNPDNLQKTIFYVKDKFIKEMHSEE